MKVINSKIIFAVFFSIFVIGCSVAETGSTGADIARLKVEGKYLVNEQGAKIQLKGISMGWHNWWGRFYTQGTVATLAEKWNAKIIRAAIGANAANGYTENPQYALACLDSIVQGAKVNGTYVLVDWHSHDNTLAAAKQFFATVSQKYGDCPNLIYELWNEPLEIEWSEVKTYAEALIPIIRKNSPNSVIIVGCPRWDQDIDKVADNPITKYDNLMYSVHFYAATHKDDLRAKVVYAIDKELPLFFTECAATNHLGDGDFDMESWDKWTALAAQNSIGVIMWDIADKQESCSMLLPEAPANGKNWNETHLKPWAKKAIEYLK